MTNKPHQRPRPKPEVGPALSARQALAARPRGELKFTVKLRPPDGDLDPGDEFGRTQMVDIAVDLRHFQLSERQLAKAAMAKFVAPIDFEDYVTVHTWVVWRRTHPDSSLQGWMDHIEWGELLDGLDPVDPARVEWDTTPEGFDPEV